MTEKHIWKNGETITADLLNGMSGYVDNAGLTTAPAFVNLQTQVDNSAVGTNLYTDTKNFDNLASWTGAGSWKKLRIPIMD